MKVFKFGGASVNSAETICNAAEILKTYAGQKILIVISAMGKTTNAMEVLLSAYLQNDKPLMLEQLAQIKSYHFGIAEKLFAGYGNTISEQIFALFDPLQAKLDTPPSSNRDYEYDQIVSFGEIISTKIVSIYLNSVGIKNCWLDVRKIIKTNNHYRNADVNWESTQKNIDTDVLAFSEEYDLFITQGFLGSTSENITTTLGREGSDYSAAIFAYCMNAESVTIWKDVRGLLNADPKYFPQATKLEKIPYKEAVELAYYGATIIHPKTIKPLENKRIPLHVKSFIAPTEAGSVIENVKLMEPLTPSYIFKFNQILVSISSKDFSFIAENNLSEIFGVFGNLGIKTNLLQNSAISFSVCIDNDTVLFDTLLSELKKNFNIRYNTNLELITIRHYSDSAIGEILHNRKVLLEQRSRLTAQFVVEKLSE